MDNHRYEVRWTQRRSKKPILLPRRIVANNREAALRALADALKENNELTRGMPKRISITLGSGDKGPTRVEWSKQ